MEDVVEAFRWYADWADGVSPLYERLARGVATDPDLLDIAVEAPESQPPPNLLLAAVHMLLLEGNDHRLAEFYPTCTDDASHPSETDSLPAFRDFCLENESRLRQIVRERRVQTNDVGRSAVLYPSFGHLVRTGGQKPLALVELGSSAGLNLYWDRFRYEYEDYGIYGAPDSPVHIESAIRGSIDPPLPESPPIVEHRAGIDVNPLDVTRTDDVTWLQSLVIPDHTWRHERLDDAIRLARADPPKLIQGDTIRGLDGVLSTVPEELTLCVFSTHTLYQLTDADVRELGDQLREYSVRRPIHWLSGDPSMETDYRSYRYCRLEDGDAEETTLAEYKSYGEWVRWLSSGQTRTA